MIFHRLFNIYVLLSNEVIIKVLSNAQYVCSTAGCIMNKGRKNMNPTSMYGDLFIKYIYNTPFNIPAIVDFRSAVQLPYDHRTVAYTDTRRTPNILGGSQIRCVAQNMEDVIISSAHRRRRICVV